MKKLLHKSKLKRLPHSFALVFKTIFWFSTGLVLGLFSVGSIVFLLFQHLYGTTIFPGIKVANIPFGGKTPKEALTYFSSRNTHIGTTTFTFTADDQIATVSAKQLQLGFDSKKMVDRAYAIGRSKNLYANLSTIVSLYLHGMNLPPAYTYSSSSLMARLAPIIQKENKTPQDAQFTFNNGKITAFILSLNGQEVDTPSIQNFISTKIAYISSLDSPQAFTMAIPINILKPKIASEDVNNLGIKELIGTGSSLFHHSADTRVYNISLAASRVNGILIAPGEIFSFDKTLGDISNLTGYKQAYVITNGHTVLGDGGGVCQVSTTLFRAVLNAGLPITERHGHAYRVSYYEEDLGPGIDATIYVPTVDLKFKNDTGHYILIQSVMDEVNSHLVYNIYGMTDGRSVSVTKPVITGQTPPPPDLYQDDPTLPTGVVKQTDFAAWGAHAVFTRTVMKNNKAYLYDTFETDYRPWQAIYLRGTGSIH